MRFTALPILAALALWAAPAAAQDRVSVPLSGFVSERYGEIVSR